MGVICDILLGGLLKLQLEVGLAEVKLCELVSVANKSSGLYRSTVRAWLIVTL